MSIRNQITIALKEDETILLETLKKKGIKIIDVFRRGLKEIAKENKEGQRV